jgi:hypothetical protein
MMADLRDRGIALRFVILIGILSFFADFTYERYGLGCFRPLVRSLWIYCPGYADSRIFSVCTICLSWRLLASVSRRSYLGTGNGGPRISGLTSIRAECSRRLAVGRRDQSLFLVASNVKNPVIFSPGKESP